MVMGLRLLLRRLWREEVENRDALWRRDGGRIEIIEYACSIGIYV